MFRANSQYHVAVTSHGTVDNIEMEVGIVGKQDDDQTFSNTKQVLVEPYTSKLVALDVSQMPLHYPRFVLISNGYFVGRKRVAR